MLKWAVAKDERRRGSSSKGGRKRRMKFSLSNLNVAEKELITSIESSGGPSGSLLNLSGSPRNLKQRLQKSNSYLNGWRGEKKDTCPNYAVTQSHPNGNYCGNNNHVTPADSKSLLYMSLDHLPLAIVKQYERMLQEAAKIEISDVCKVNHLSPHNNIRSSHTILKNDEKIPKNGMILEERFPGAVRENGNRPIKSKISSSSGIRVKESSKSNLCSGKEDKKSWNKPHRSTNINEQNVGSLKLVKNLSNNVLKYSEELKKKEVEPESRCEGNKTSSECCGTRKPFQSLDNIDCTTVAPEMNLVGPLAPKVNGNHDTTDPEFLEKSVIFSTPAVPRRAKKFTLKRGELRKLERIRNQTERLNRYLKKHYHDCLPNLTEEEEEQCSPEDKSLSASVLRTHWVEETFLSSPESDSSRVSEMQGSSTSYSLSTPSPNNAMESDLEVSSRWQNCKNSVMIPGCDLRDLPVIPEDSENCSSTPTSDSKLDPEFVRRDLADSFFMTSNLFNDHAHHAHLYGAEREKQENSLLIDTSLLCVAGKDAECRKLQGMSLTAEPLEDSFDVPPSVRDVEEELVAVERSPPIGSSEKGSEEGGDEGPGSYFPAQQHEIRLQNNRRLHHNHQFQKSQHCSIYDEKEESAHYYSSENETWNSHEYPSRSPCESCETSFSLPHALSFSEDPPQHLLHDLGPALAHREESPHRYESSPLPLPSSPLPSNQLQANKIINKTTPKKLVRKPPVKSNFTGKGEVLIHIYRNGDYVTLHVVQAKNLQPSYRSSWKLAIKISVLPEAEETFTRSESISVPENRSYVKIDQKFSFEIPSTQADRKVFLTFVKRLEKKTSFLGWTTLDLQVSKSTQCWLKLRKRKMSCGAFPTSRHQSGMSINGSSQKKAKTFSSPVPTEIETIEELERLSVSPESETDVHHHIPKSQLQNSSTMDSGVEDCCEPIPVPSIDFDDTSGSRVTVRMLKPENSGFGFSVVWVSPPRIERLEKDKVADLAGLRIGDLIIGVNGEDVMQSSNATIYQKMKSTLSELELEVWRKYPSESSVGSSSPKVCSINSSVQTGPMVGSSSLANSNAVTSRSAETPMSLRQTSSVNNSSKPAAPHLPENRFPLQPPPVSILKPPPPAPPVRIGVTPALPQMNSQQNNSSWRIRFNIELLDNEDDFLRKFFIQELKFFRKVVSALDRYLIPAQANHLLTPQEIHLIFAHIITIITMTKRILQCIANGASSARWNLGKILHSTHSDHLSEIKSAYTSYGTSLGNSAMILSEKMTLQAFARFVIETPVPKGHLDMTSLLFAPFEHLRNLCEISEEIAQNHEKWVCTANQLKECYAEIVVQTDFMEPISHISMKKNPLLSVRDLEKRIVLTNCQALKVSEKGRKWLFGSRLFRREADGSWSPVWAFLFSDCIVLTSHTTRDRVFFVKEPPIRLEDVVTLHFNLPRKNENEFRLLFGPETQPNRLDKILPIYRNKKSNQAILRTTNVQLKSMWKLLLQRQIITLNTRLSKSSSSNFSISEFCERFPLNPQPSTNETTMESRSPALTARNNNLNTRSDSNQKDSLLPPSRKAQLNAAPDKTAIISAVPGTPEPAKMISPAKQIPLVGIHSIAKELMKNRMMQIPENAPLQPSPPQPLPKDAPETIVKDNVAHSKVNVENSDSRVVISTPPPVAKAVTLNTSKLDGKSGSSETKNVNPKVESPPTPIKSSLSSANQNSLRIKSLATIPENSPSRNSPSRSLNLNNNNNNIQDFNGKTSYDTDKCRCKTVDDQEKVLEEKKSIVRKENDVSFVLKKKIEEKGSSLSESLTNKVTVESNLSKVSASTNSCSNTPTRSTGSTHRAIITNRPEIVDTSVKTITEVALRDSPEIKEKVEERSQVQNPPLLSTSVSNTSQKPIQQTQPTTVSSEVAAVSKPKPGSKIITNATLKSRQQEVLIAKLQTEKSSDTIITEKSDTTYKTDSTQYQSIRQGPGTIQNFMESSTSPAFRCHSENGQATAKPKPNKDSPIVSGFGSEKSRRRLLYDYKIKRDYPELFGITPKDRRSFIKKLAVETNEKVFVAPYYYRTYSPIPVTKQTHGESTLEGETSKSIIRDCKEQVVDFQEEEDDILTLPINENTVDDPVLVQETENVIPVKDDNFNNDTNNITESVVSTISSIEMPKIEQDRESESENELCEIPKNLLKEGKEDLSLVDELEEDSEAESGGQDQENQENSKTNRRSPEESSNDSGISDEIKTDKRKSIIPAIESFSLPTTNKSECDSVVSVSLSSCVVNSLSHTTEGPSSISVLESGARNIIEEEDAMELELDQSVETSRNSSIGLQDGETSLADGQEPLQTPHPVLVLKVDKSTATDDDIHFCWASHLPEKSFRNLMAERREAFFHHAQMGTTCSSAASSVPVNEPLIVKIIDGGTVHSTQPQVEPPPKPPVERVLLTRFEKETTARVERVESSDDSTSSDAASASPAAENGTTDPSWSSSSSSLAGYSSFKEDTSTSHAAAVCSKIMLSGAATSSSAAAYGQMFFTCDERCSSSASMHPPTPIITNGQTNSIHVLNGSVHNYYQIARGPEIVVTQESPDTPSNSKNEYSSDGEVDSIVLNGKTDSLLSNGSDGSGRQELLRVESNDSTAENYGDDDDEDYNFDEDEEDLSHCSVATINRYGTYESLEKIESEDSVGVLPEFPRTMSRSKARFTFEDDDDDDEDLFEEDFESDFNFRFPTQIQDNTYSVSRLGPLPPLLEEDYEDEVYDEQRPNGPSPGCSHETNGATLRSRHETGLRRDNSFLLARLATMYARSSISPLKLLRELWLKKRYREWVYKE